MAINLSDSVLARTSAPIDSKWGPYFGDTLQSAISSALSMLLPSYRYEGLTVGLIASGHDVVEYWFYGGVQNENLILKITDLSGLYPITGGTLNGSLNTIGNVIVGGGINVSQFSTMSSLMVTGATGSGGNGIEVVNGILAQQLKSGAAQGMEPLVVQSKTTVTNLSADMLDGYHQSHFVNTGRTITVGNGLIGGGQLSSNLTISHKDTSSTTNVLVGPDDGMVVNHIGLGFDEFGHVTGATLSSANFDYRYLRVAGDSIDVGLIDISGFTGEGVYLELSGGTLNGSLGINVDSPQYPLHVSGQTGGVSILATNEIAQNSDMTLKENIVKIENALDKIDTINGYTFNMIGSSKRSAGVIAQEVQEILPEVISINDGLLSVAYGNMIALTIEAIKELRKEVLELREMINSK